MGSRLGRRVVHFANLPIKLLMPTTFNNITEIALKTIPSASKIEIKRVLESLYGFEVEKVQTLNMEGKKKKRGGILIAKPDYKKAYVTLRNPLSISPDLFPIKVIENEKEKMRKESKASVVDEQGQEVKQHWLDGSGNKPQKLPNYRGHNRNFQYRGDLRERASSRMERGNRGDRDAGTAKFPWTSMHSAK
ncbi:hypothetical protein ACHQM5_011711 [Ranunculus cassubicifolius]